MGLAPTDMARLPYLINTNKIVFSSRRPRGGGWRGSTNQGEKIGGRIFADLSIAYFGQFWKRKGKFWATFSAVLTSNAVILTKNGLGYILGAFFTNASGHTGTDASIVFRTVGDFRKKNFSIGSLATDLLLMANFKHKQAELTFV
jgi:hypothetical protein